MSHKFQNNQSVLMCNTYGVKPRSRSILKHAFEVIQNACDNRDKLHAMEVFKDTHLVKLELLSNATTIDSALNYIRDKQQYQQQQITSTDQPVTGGKQTIF